MKKIQKKLILKKKTISKLNGHQMTPQALNQINGGAGSHLTCTVQTANCPTELTCPQTLMVKACVIESCFCTNGCPQDF